MSIFGIQFWLSWIPFFVGLIEYKNRQCYNNVKYSYKITYIYKQAKTGTINVYRPLGKTTLMLITCTKDDESTQTVYVAELVG